RPYSFSSQLILIASPLGCSIQHGDVVRRTLVLFHTTSLAPRFRFHRPLPGSGFYRIVALWSTCLVVDENHLGRKENELGEE
ncbi:hypothetical protein C8J56DRAFT_1173968, partial [Mycena floridula]